MKSRQQFGVEPAALTAAEAEYLIGFRDADELRNRAAKARQENRRRLRAKGVQEESSDQVSPGTPEDPDIRFARSAKERGPRKPIGAERRGHRAPQAAIERYQ
ncbi:MAG: hypothetical protein U5K56_09930 [Halioglobus sp.]|nr:hypothetical protein [Halioglobus sp.]